MFLIVCIDPGPNQFYELFRDGHSLGVFCDLIALGTAIESYKTLIEGLSLYEAA